MGNNEAGWWEEETNKILYGILECKFIGQYYEFIRNLD